MGNKFSLPKALNCSCFSKKSVNVARTSPVSHRSDESVGLQRSLTPTGSSRPGSRKSNVSNGFDARSLSSGEQNECLTDYEIPSCSGINYHDKAGNGVHETRTSRIDCKTKASITTNKKAPRSPSFPRTANVSQSHEDLLALFVTDPVSKRTDNSNRASRNIKPHTGKRSQHCWNKASTSSNKSATTVNAGARPVRPKAARGRRTAPVLTQEFALPGYIADSSERLEAGTSLPEQQGQRIIDDFIERCLEQKPFKD
ncbi:hypothetical protein SNE40_001165 [Patella caerulea]|uniref:Uncharacterized protein n=1 Tax=Patella caerulea TaxID=87958 RepID=A0AAN8KM23_PATCE